MLEFESEKYTNITSTLCCICQWRMPYGLPVCKWCWDRYKPLIASDPPWYEEIKRDAQKERRRIHREWGNISLNLIQEWEESFDECWRC